MEKEDIYINQTKNWIKQVVIKHSLCPFAQSPFQTDQIRYITVGTRDLAYLLKVIHLEAEFLIQEPSEEIETTLIIAPNLFDDFRDYWDFSGLLEDAFKKWNMEGLLQLATFHPEYQFAGTLNSDAENYTNRSPYPSFHLLREASVEKALAHFKSPEQIPERNINEMKKMGLEYWEALLARIKEQK